MITGVKQSIAYFLNKIVSLSIWISLMDVPELVIRNGRADLLTDTF